jgi:hypothetical protein
VPAAEWSEKAAVEDQQHVLPTIIAQADLLAAVIGQREIGSRGIELDFRHGSSLRKKIYSSAPRRKAATRAAIIPPSTRS